MHMVARVHVKWCAQRLRSMVWFGETDRERKCW